MLKLREKWGWRESYLSWTRSRGLSQPDAGGGTGNGSRRLWDAIVTSVPRCVVRHGDWKVDEMLKTERMALRAGHVAGWLELVA
jgi:hypothetical protein